MSENNGLCSDMDEEQCAALLKQHYNQLKNSMCEEKCQCCQKSDSVIQKADFKLLTPKGLKEDLALANTAESDKS